MGASDSEIWESKNLSQLAFPRPTYKSPIGSHGKLGSSFLLHLCLGDAYAFSRSRLACS
jgi:hypothetical protein